MTKRKTRKLVFSKLLDFDKSLANIYFENLAGEPVKGQKYIKCFIDFGATVATSLGVTTETNLLIIQIFYEKNSGSVVKDDIVENLDSFLSYKTISNDDGYVQFIGSTVNPAGEEGGYIHEQYSIPFIHYKEIA